jgi:hypothetical protein
MDNVGHDSVPEYFTLQITAVNNTDKPIEFLISHYYNFSWPAFINTITSNSDYINITVPANKSITIEGEELYADIETITKGFYLVDSRLRYMEIDVISSFEVKIITDNDTINLAGYETTNDEYDDSGLGFINIQTDIGGRFCFFESKSQQVFFNISNKPYVLPVTITTHKDGTYSFEHDVITAGDGIGRIQFK